jgi:DNA primase
MTDQYLLFGGSEPLESREFTLVSVAVDLLGERIQKRPISPRWRGLCPFHQERTPSFYLEPQWDRFKCYGCGRAGGPIMLALDLAGDPTQYLAKYRLDLDDMCAAIETEKKRFGRIESTDQLLILSIYP